MLCLSLCVSGSRQKYVLQRSCRNSLLATKHRSELMWTPQEILTLHMSATKHNMFMMFFLGCTFQDFQLDKASDPRPLFANWCGGGGGGGNVALSTASPSSLPLQWPGRPKGWLWLPIEGCTWLLGPWIALLLLLLLLGHKCWPRKLGARWETAVVETQRASRRVDDNGFWPHQPTFPPAEQSLSEK